MSRLAITGHRGLPEQTMRLVNEALREELADYSPNGLIGLSCLADGADTLFARAVLDRGGKLVAIIPAAKYREGLPEEHHTTYDALFAQASEVIELPHVESDSQAHMDGSLRMLEEADALLAVWDGKPARGYGGTADIVEAARERGVPLTVLWPEGATRD